MTTTMFAAVPVVNSNDDQGCFWRSAGVPIRGVAASRSASVSCGPAGHEGAVVVSSDCRVLGDRPGVDLRSRVLRAVAESRWCGSRPLLVPEIEHTRLVGRGAEVSVRQVNPGVHDADED